MKENGHETKLIHVSDELDYSLDIEKIVKDIKEYDPGLIAFSSVTNQWFYVKIIAKFIRRSCSTPIVVGGHHANAAAEEIIKEDAVDFVCKGEGEIPLLELVNRIEQGKSLEYIPNMTTKCRTETLAVSMAATGTDGAIPISIGSCSNLPSPKIHALNDEISIIANPVDRWIDDLDSLPFEDREVFDYDRIVETRDGWAEVIASRGCPYACTYCFNVPFFDMYKDDLKETEKKVKMKDFIRRRSVESTVAMLQNVRDNNPHVKSFTFVDDVFAIYSRWLADLAPLYAEKVGLPFAATSQPLAFNEKIAGLLKEMGCKVVKMGVEAGDPEIRNKVLNRNIPDKVLIDSFELARKYGLKPQAFNMIGLPTETRENMLRTASLNSQLRAYIVWVSTFMPYPGTVLDVFCRENDLVDETRWDEIKSYRGGSVLKETSYTHLELEQVRVLFRWYLNYYMNNECSETYKKNIDELTAMSKDKWMSGDVEKIWQERDPQIDEMFRKQKVDHYVGKKYVNILWAKEYDYDLS
ncbi:MAG: B12-binding domain-containing radical SAM protein [Gammaproteobacteria bacterium]|nr:B12-binding domain-containing radical SAM protein [Gammaproteobacteria bacterium]